MGFETIDLIATPLFGPVRLDVDEGRYLEALRAAWSRLTVAEVARLYGIPAKLLQGDPPPLGADEAELPAALGFDPAEPIWGVSPVRRLLAEADEPVIVTGRVCAAALPKPTPQPGTP